MGVLDIVAGLAKTAGAGYNAYGAEKDEQVKQALASAKATQDAERNRVLNLLTQREINTPRLGDANFGQVSGDADAAKIRATTPAKVAEADALRPGTIATAAGTAKATAPIALQTHKDERKFDNANMPANFTTAQVGADPNVPGSGEVVSVNTKTGERGSVIGAAKSGASTAKLTDPQEKSYLFYNLMKNAEPEITNALGSGQIRPAAVSTYLGAGSASEIPLVGKAIGAIAKPAANANLNEDEQKLIRAGKDFTAGVLRKESGAAVTASELMETMERYFPGMFGDKPGLTDAKTLARQQYMETMRQEAGPATQFYGRQAKPPAPADPEFDALMARYKKRP